MNKARLEAFSAGIFGPVSASGSRTFSEPDPASYTYTLLLQR